MCEKEILNMQEDEYKKETKVLDKSNEEKEVELIVSIIKTKKELEVANLNFEYAQEDLIDYYTYQIKAMRAKFDYLLKKAKKKGLALDMIEQIDINYNKVI